LIADRVIVTSKQNDDYYIWKSDEDKNFTIRKDESSDNLIRETKFYSQSERRSCRISRREKKQRFNQKHSKFIGYQINLDCKKTKEKEIKYEVNETNMVDKEK
jgi:HSP90 family molecular chaperone